MTIVTRYEDVQEVLSRDTVFQTPYADGFKALTGGRNFFLGMGNTADYQRDTSNMRIVVRRDDLGRIATISGSSADRAVAAAPGRLDVVTLAQQVAMDFVAEYFGVVSPTPDTIASASAAISAYLFLSADNLRASAQTASAQVLTLLRDTVAERKLDRGKHDDVLERCLVLQDAAVPGMDEETLLVNLFGLVVGAIPTTVAMATRAVDELLNHPDELALAHTAAAAGDAATVVQYVSEAMRLSPLGPGVPRNVLADYTIAKGTLRAKTVKAGTKVLAALQSATLDGNIIDSPNDFRIGRPDYDYMHFGYGLHTCFGRYINMVQIPRIVQAILARPNLRRAVGDDGTMQMSGPFPSQLIVEFDGRAR
jgi:cytochrome P450